MFENKTFENILSTMRGYVSARNPDLDTRDGSIIYTALAPIAMELETAYHDMDMILEETFLDTASKDYLIKHGNQIGLEINDATFGEYKGKFNVEVEVGSRFNLDKFNYTVTEKLSDPTDDDPYYYFNLVCETPGAEPNDYLGTLTPITFVDNLTHAELTEVLVYGEDEEDTEAYRYRLQLHVKNPPSDANVYQYNEWLNDYDGVGKYKVVPCWNGVNTVKLLVLNAEDKPASDELIADVQEHFDPLDSPGMGMGQAPIGAVVTVTTATEVPVKVECKLTLKEGYSEPIGVQDAVDSYLNSIVFDKTSVGYMPISAVIYNAESVDSVNSLKITVNGTTVMDSSVSPFVDSVAIGADDVAVLDVNNSTWEVQ